VHCATSAVKQLRENLTYQEITDHYQRPQNFLQGAGNINTLLILFRF